MNHPSGLSAAAVQVYRLRVTHPTDSVTELGCRAGLPPEVVIAAESELTRLGLLRTSPAGGWVAVGPETATEELVAATEHEILQLQVALGATRAKMQALSAHYMEARSLRSARGDIETVRGLDNIRAVIDDLARTATTTVDTLAPGGGQGEQALSAALPNDLRVLSRGCQLRILFQDSARRHKPTGQYVTRITAAGAQARCLSHLPTRMILYGDDCAVLPIDHERTGLGVIVVRDASVLGFLRWLYDHHWSQATDFFVDEHESPLGLSSVEAEILSQLASGRTNPTISAELGMSERTVARIVAGLMERLGAGSRFEAGVRAVQLGWVS
ncbi:MULTISPECIES: helix-turn-helix transcriptional regulator [unclassified Streptomyces]|uniref:helix-turn-helix transcriptional regulator n=1 Tax=unclassified Streptomyces TaxID=2593676 RepID=UPI00215639F5|nr:MULTISPECIES: helix-turn-helix transcriptional regulator [unclassified Streptomyces]